MLFSQMQRLYEKYETCLRGHTKLSFHFRQTQSSMMPHKITKLTAAKRKQGQKCNCTTTLIDTLHPDHYIF